jgi:hypothetical protein
MSKLSSQALPVAVIGAGPVGLAAAAHLVFRGETPLVLEAGPSAGASVRRWGHVRIFSPWRFNVDKVAAALLRRQGWVAPPDGDHPTGHELVDQYLAPLASLPELRPHVRYGARVRGIARRGYDRMKTDGRDRAPFVLRVEEDGEEKDVLARAVIDASGTYETPNPLGANGVPALGETSARERIHYGIPDVLGRDLARYAGRRVLVVGSGHSAFGVLLDLIALREQEPTTSILWAVRRGSLDHVFGGGAKDQLAERGQLGARMRAMVKAGALTVFTGVHVTRLSARGGGIVVAADDRELPAVDEVVAATGFRPDLSILREVRLELDATVESPALLAPLIDPNEHSCGSVPPHGYEELRQPEPDFYVVGMKAYGRAPTFLMLTGYEQVRSVVAALAGDMKAARDVQLVLPETGVCSTDFTNGTSGGCCVTPVAESTAGSCGTGGCAAPEPALALKLAPREAKAAGCC